MTIKESKIPVRRLNSHEPKVSSLVAEGYENEEVASELGLAMNAVHRHKGDLMDIRLFLETLDFSP